MDDALCQKLLDAYNSGDLDTLNSLLPASSGSTAAAPQSDFFDPNEGQQPQTPAPQAGFFDPNGGQGQPQQETEQPPQFASSGVTGTGGAGAALLNKFADTATFGLAPKAEAYLASKMYGVPYEQAAEAVEERDKQLSAAHPYANVGGALAGILGGGTMLGGAMRATPGLRALVPVEGGSKLLNLGKEALVAGGLSGGEEALHGGTPMQIGLATAAGGVVGPVVGAVAGKGLSMAAKPLSKAWRYVANRVGVDPDVAAAWLAAHPGSSVAQFLSARQAGTLRRFAEQNPVAGEVLQNAQQRFEGQMPGKMAEAVEDALGSPVRPSFLRNVEAKSLSPNSIAEAKDAAMDAAIAPISNDTVEVPASLVREAQFNKGVPFALRDTIAKEMKAVDPEDADATIPITIRAADTIRRNLRRLQKSPANLGEDYGEFADQLRDIASEQHSGYGKALEEYGNASQFEAGFAHGYKGGVRETVGSDSPADLRAALRTAHGENGRRAGYVLHLRNKAAESARGARSVAEEVSNHTSAQNAAATAVGNAPGSDQLRGRGAALRAADKALTAAAPGALRNAEEETGSALGHVAFGAAQAGAGMTHSGGFRVLHGLQNLMSAHRFPPEVQERVMTGLTSGDPAIQRATLESLRQAVRESNAIRNFQLGTGAVGGSALANTIFQGGGQ